MAIRDLARRIAPFGFAGVLLLITAAAAASAGGGVSAQTVASACTYSLCPSDNSPFTPFTVAAILGILLLVALVLGVLILRDRRRGGARPPAPWSDAAVSAAGPLGGPGGPTGEGGAAPATYTETPEDVSAPPPDLPASPPPGGAAGESDIDSLMAELDKISGEILKRGQPAKKEPPTEGGSEDGSGGS